MTPTRDSRRRRAARYAAILVGLLVVIGIPVAVKYAQLSTLMAFGQEMQRAGQPPEAVGSAVATVESWERTLPAVGTVAFVSSVQVSNDSPGLVSRILFDSGDMAKTGQPLVELDASVERARLASMQAQKRLARVTVARSRALVARDALGPAQLDTDVAELERTTAEAAALEAEIERKLVRAPFPGRLGLREISVGQYLPSGTRVTVLDRIGPAYVDFTVPQEERPGLAVGMPVRVALQGNPTTAEGHIVAIDPTVDDLTRSTKVRAEAANLDGRLRPGMFVRVSVVRPEQARVVAVPATAIVHASYGDSVFVIEERRPGAPGMAQTPEGRPVKVVRQQFVRLGPARGDFVALAEGVAAGQVVVSAGAFKLRNGAPVVVDDSVKATPELAPRPENR